MKRKQGLRKNRSVMNVTKIIYRYPCSLLLILNLCFFPRTFDFHFASFFGLFRTSSGQTGLTNPYSSGPGDLENYDLSVVKQNISKEHNAMMHVKQF